MKNTGMQQTLIFIFSVLFLTDTSSAHSRHHQCKRVEANKVLKRRDTAASIPCAGKLVSNSNLNRIPKVIPEIVCPAEEGDRCIQLILPMVVGMSEADGQFVEKTIYVPSGCVDSHHVKKPKKKGEVSTNSQKLNKPPKNSKSVKDRKRRLSVKN